MAANDNDMILPPYHSEWIGRSGSLSRNSPQISVLPIGCTCTSNLKWQEDIPGNGICASRWRVLFGLWASSMHSQTNNKRLKLVFFMQSLTCWTLSRADFVTRSIICVSDFPLVRMARLLIKYLFSLYVAASQQCINLEKLLSVWWDLCICCNTASKLQ